MVDVAAGRLTPAEPPLSKRAGAHVHARCDCPWPKRGRSQAHGWPQRAWDLFGIGYPACPHAGRDGHPCVRQAMLHPACYSHQATAPAVCDHPTCPARPRYSHLAIRLLQPPCYSRRATAALLCPCRLPLSGRVPAYLHPAGVGILMPTLSSVFVSLEWPKPLTPHPCVNCGAAIGRLVV